MPSTTTSQDTLTIRGFEYANGASVLCRWDTGVLTPGHIYFSIRDGVHQGIVRSLGSIWLCHDDRRYDGNTSPDMLGHDYSWHFCYNSSTEELTDQVRDIWPLADGIQPKNPSVSEKLRCFLASHPLRNQVMLCMSISAKPFDVFTEFDLSDTPGNIKMSGSVTTPKGVFPKDCDIRLGRFFARMSESLKKAGMPVRVTDRQVEDMHNSLVAFQSGDYYKAEYLSGGDIKEAYKVKNYSKGSIGTLHKSCMNGKGSLLKLYTKNPSAVRLAVLRSEHGIEARCLVWRSGGKQYYDRIYFTHDWVRKILEDKLVSDGCKSIHLARTIKHVDLEVSLFDEYPFVDSFKYLDQENARLYFVKDESLAGKLGLPAGVYKRLTHTDGSCLSVHFDGSQFGLSWS
jgi:hypothetical protein